MLPKEAFLQQYTSTFSTYFFHFTNRTIISCFQSVNMKILLVKNIFSCWCTILPCKVACVLLSERQHDAFALGGNVSHMCHSGEGNFSDSAGYTCGLMNHATSYRTTFHLKRKTVSITRNFWDFNVAFCILKLVGYFHGILVELPPPFYVSIQGNNDQRRDRRIGWNNSNSSVFRPQKKKRTSGNLPSHH